MCTLGKKMAATLLGTCTMAIGAGTAAADVEDYFPLDDPGISVTVGGGVSDFMEEDMRNTTDTGGMWELRMIAGTRSLIALEAAYVGTAQAIDARFGPDTTATLVGTGLEGAIRVNVLPMQDFTPYAFGGVGWKRYDVTGEDFTTSDVGIQDEDNQVEIPFGAGLAYRYEGFLADARFTYRVATGEDMVLEATTPTSTNEDALNMDNWQASARLGFEF